ncbi:MAG: hypothetical protein H6843_00965 [Rhodospirillaceae bacterium]|nr:hypothetical protein [Rhodospirillaceae bacterium]
MRTILLNFCTHRVRSPESNIPSYSGELRERLARDFSRKRFGDDGYAREAAYNGHWLDVLQPQAALVTQEAAA